MNWKTFSGMPVSASINEIVEQAIIEESNKGYKVRICVGTDSQVKTHTINFASVIAVVREKHGGFMFIHRSSIRRNGMQIKERLIMEVGKSVEIAYHINEVLVRHNVPLEVHADISQNEDCLSHVALKEALGYIKGMGFEFKVKPDSFASSSCADRLV
ncbi:MAG TPA: ribonuclease H-like YkuK family protein [Membranihabitans sp.]|nr:ribonuclease H-like YkuK family protein [Membranihabitans sp.]